MTELEEEAEPLTYDSVHWAEVVNLIKVSLVDSSSACFQHLPNREGCTPAILYGVSAFSGDT